MAIAATCALFACGCSPEVYSRSADAQVQQILRDRQKQTLGYQPPTDLPADRPSPPTTQAFEKVPTTPIPPELPSPMEPFPRQGIYSRLGPTFPVSVVDPKELEEFGVAAAISRASRRLRLGPPAPWETAIRLDLFGCLRYAGEHSRDYQTQLENLYLAALDVTLQRHFFDLIPFAQTGLKYDGGQQTVKYNSALTAFTNAGVKQKLPYGGQIVAQAMVDFVDALNAKTANAETATLALSGSIPLLRGAGTVALEPLISTERELIYSVRGFEDFRRGFIVSVSRSYFNLLTQQNGLLNRQLNYTNLQSLTERTQALYDAGRLTFIQVQQAMQAQLSAEATLVDAQASYQSAVDQFKIVLGMPAEEELSIVPVYLDLRLPRLDSDQAVAFARKYRLDLQTARDRIEDAHRNVHNAENGLLPDLDLAANVQTGNRPKSDAGNIVGDETTYSASLTLDLPLDRVAERNIYRRSIINFHQTQRDFEELEDRIAIAARDAVRAIASAQTALRIQEVSIRLAQSRLDFANERLKQGIATARDVVDAQTSLLQAQDAYERGRAQLQTSLLQYLQQTGLLRVAADGGALGEAINPTGETNKTAGER